MMLRSGISTKLWGLVIRAFSSPMLQILLKSQLAVWLVVKVALCLLLVAYAIAARRHWVELVAVSLSAFTFLLNRVLIVHYLVGKVVGVLCRWGLVVVLAGLGRVVRGRVAATYDIFENFYAILVGFPNDFKNGTGIFFKNFHRVFSSL